MVNYPLPPLPALVRESINPQESRERGENKRKRRGLASLVESDVQLLLLVCIGNGKIDFGISVYGDVHQDICSWRDLTGHDVEKSAWKWKIGPVGHVARN